MEITLVCLVERLSVLSVCIEFFDVSQCNSKSFNRFGSSIIAFDNTSVVLNKLNKISIAVRVDNFRDEVVLNRRSERNSFKGTLFRLAIFLVGNKV